MKKWGFLFVFVLLVGFTVYTNMNKSMAVVAEQKPTVGYSAPHFSLVGLDGQTYKVGGKREKPLVINFWASWCGPCKEEAPDLAKMYNKYKGQVDFYAVNSTSNDQLADAKKFVETFNLPFPIPMDEKGEVSKQYQIMAFPTTFFVDKNGMIVHQVLGMLDEEELEKQLKKLL
ncbi:TlpA family protein disulfide reductase [Brevibacillus fluminis]|uniref:TlpA family protein disulfide reductase n=1 Tax=Brevibacillus fluminis TaxID=511487 RepID=A0A3M8DVY0_9BACL|nr:TlpA disulfide reductase family protein [Brevibacillus fluminis]RNB91659.1 TlpA family protein disulfide reductase [Brevibacillus fluminis]